MRIRTISTGQLCCMGDQECLILQCCGGDPQEWLDGINEILAQECILKKVISLTSAGKNPLSKLADISLNTNSKETKYRVVSIASRVAALTIADSIYTYIAMRTDGAKSLQIEKSMESLKY